jgi:ElaB/YqjD/DUF883 family membrane-anchored ribosome-binding protein
MGQTAEELRNDIERTRQDLSRDVDAISDKVSPGRVMRRRMDQTRGFMSSVRERVMGTASTASSSVSDGASSARSGASDAIASAPDAVLRRTEGNPLAAGAVAFAAGWLVSSLLPATKTEQNAAEAVEDKARGLQEPVKAQAADMTQQIKEPLREQAQHAVQSVRDSAAESAETVQEQAQASAENVRTQARDAT